METKSKRILVTSFAYNDARMEAIFYCAKKTDRKISLVGRSMHRIYKAAKQCGYMQNLIEPLDPREAKKVSRNLTVSSILSVSTIKIDGDIFIIFKQYNI